MGTHIPQQLALFFSSILLGGALALVYDLVRPLRRLGGRIWGGVLDALLSAGSVVSVFLFVMAGEGELRLFVLAGVLGGAVLFFCLFSPLLRPIWGFWAEVLLLPLTILTKTAKKVGRGAKKLFSFWKSWFTIICRKLCSEPPEKEEDGEMAKTAKKKRPSSKLTALILVVLMLGIGIQLYNMQEQLRAAEAEQAAYTQHLEALAAENARLAQDIANSDDPEVIEEIARNELGMGEAGEKVFRVGS